MKSPKMENSNISKEPSKDNSLLTPVLFKYKRFDLKIPSFKMSQDQWLVDALSGCKNEISNACQSTRKETDNSSKSWLKSTQSSSSLADSQLDVDFQQPEALFSITIKHKNTEKVHKEMPVYVKQNGKRNIFKPCSNTPKKPSKNTLCSNSKNMTPKVSKHSVINFKLRLVSVISIPLWHI